MNKIKNITLLAITALTLSSCGLYSKFESPTIDENAKELYTYLQANEDTTTIATIDWKTFFSDSLLQDLIAQALENNTDLRLAKLSVDQAQIALNTAKLAYIPSLNFNPSASYSYSSGSSNKTYSISAAASWEIDLFGKLTATKRMEQAAVEQSKVYKDAVQTQLIATLANSYYSLMMLDEQLKISIKTKANWTDNLKAMEALMQAGNINNSSVLQTKASSVALDAQITELKYQISEMENSISNLLAKAPTKIKRGELKNVSFPSDLAIGVPVQLLANRADVKVAEYDLAQAFYATSYAKASLYPSITLSGSAGYTNSGVSLGDPATMLYNAAMSLLQPIFNRGTLKAQVKISKSQQEQALLTFNQTVLDAGSEVNTALGLVQTARELVKYDNNQIELLQEVVDNKELLMEHGSVNYLEVLSAQLSLLQSELSLTSDIYSEIQGTIDLYRALGGGAK